jgi:hypothetical protein
VLRGCGATARSTPGLRELAMPDGAQRSSVRPFVWAAGASEDGGRRYRPQRAGRPPGAPEGRALDTNESQIRQHHWSVGVVCRLGT